MNRAALDRATAALDPPFAVVDLDAFDANAADLLRRAGATAVRLASKSVRCRALQRRALDAGLRGQLCFTLPEALWLADQGFDDLVVAYPTADRAALRALAHGPHRGAIAVMVDSRAHLDLVRRRAAAPCACAWTSTPAGGRCAGGSRSASSARPCARPQQAAALAADAVARPGIELVGPHELRGAHRGRRRRAAGAPRLRRRGPAPCSARARASWPRGARRSSRPCGRWPPLEFVNGGGTGSIERTAAEAAVTEVTAGSGLYGPTLFDAYRAFDVRPAALFALPVVRKPSPASATVLGGGYLASGAGGADRLPRPVLPAGLRLDRAEGAGEVQTPVLGPAARDLALGDRVWFRHAKAGELCERFAGLHLVRGEEIVDEVATYRGEGQTFL